MQWWWCLAWLGFVVAAHAASIIKKDIPVKVLYEKSPEDDDYNSRNLASVRNLDAKLQLSPDELLQAEKFYEASRNANGIRNLDAKVQLSEEELNVASKHLPVVAENDVKLKLIAAPDDTPIQPEEEDKLLFQKIEEIIENGVENIKRAVESADTGKSVKPEVWTKLDKEIERFLEGARDSKNSVRQTAPQPPDFFQNLAEQFQNITGGFVSQFTNQIQGGNPTQQSDESQSGGFGQNVLNVFQNGFHQIQTGLSQLSGQATQNSTILGDPASTTTGPFQGLINQAQGVFASFNPFNQGSTQAPGTQGDEQSTATNPIQSIQNVFSQFGQQIGQLNPFTVATQAPGTQGDEQTTVSGPVQFVQGIQQVFNQFNPFNPQTTTTQKSPAQADPTKNPVQAAAENFAGQVSQGVSSLANQPGNPLQGLGNPAEGLQQVGQQVAGAITSGNPLQGGSNPVAPLQEIAQQVGGQLTSGNPLQGGSNPLQEIGGQLASIVPGNPLQGIGGGDPAGALQGLVQQAAGAVASGGNPLQPGKIETETVKVESPEKKNPADDSSEKPALELLTASE